MTMPPYQRVVVRRKGRFESPVDYVKATIPFTFVRSWIKLPLSWKVLQLLHPNFLLVIRSSLLTPPPVDNEIDLDSSLVCPPPSEPGCAKPAPNQPLVGESVDLGSPSVDYFVPEEHHDSIAHVLLISSDSPESENNPPILADQGGPPSVPVE